MINKNITYFSLIIFFEIFKIIKIFFVIILCILNIMFKIHYNLLCSSIIKINNKKELFLTKQKYWRILIFCNVNNQNI